MPKRGFRFSLTKKKLSAAQKNSLALANEARRKSAHASTPEMHSRRTEKENIAPTNKQQIQALNQKVTYYRDQFYNTRKKSKRDTTRHTHAVAILSKQLDDEKKARTVTETTMQEKERETMQTNQQIHALHGQLLSTTAKLVQLVAQQSMWRRRCSLLRMQRYRALKGKQSAAKRASEKAVRKARIYKTKSSGKITSKCRGLIQDLVSNIGLSKRQIMPTIKRIAQEMDVDVVGNASNASITNIVLEGGVAAQMQLVDEASKAEGKSD